MVRTSGGIRISAGKSSKKSGGAGGGSRSAPSTPSGKSGSRGSSRLPPIPHCEAPSWQKPITNFFSTGAGSSKDNENVTKNIICENDDEKIGQENYEGNAKGSDFSIENINEDKNQTPEKDNDETEKENIDDLNVNSVNNLE